MKTSERSVNPPYGLRVSNIIIYPSFAIAAGTKQNCPIDFQVAEILPDIMLFFVTIDDHLNQVDPLCLRDARFGTAADLLST